MGGWLPHEAEVADRRHGTGASGRPPSSSCALEGHPARDTERRASARGPPPWQVGREEGPCVAPASHPSPLRRCFIPLGQPQCSSPIPGPPPRPAGSPVEGSGGSQPILSPPPRATSASSPPRRPARLPVCRPPPGGGARSAHPHRPPFGGPLAPFQPLGHPRRGSPASGTRCFPLGPAGRAALPPAALASGASFPPGRAARHWRARQRRVQRRLPSGRRGRRRLVPLPPAPWA